MKLTYLILFIGLFQVNANGYSQDAKVSFEIEGQPLEVVFRIIENQTDYHFFYSKGELNTDQKIFFSAKNEKVSNVLNRIFKGTAISYTLYNNQVILLKNEKVKTALKIPDQQVVQGTVTNEQGMPLISVTVLIKGTNKGTITNFDGQYRIQINNPNASLVFSYVGYETKEIAVNDRENIDVVLEEKVGELEEVVLVGYGETKKRNLTGSVSTIEMENIRETPVASVNAAMVGKAAGVQIIKANGAPGGSVKIEIRGGTSLMGGNTPLYVIDGVPVTVNDNYYIDDNIAIVSPIEAQGYGEGFNNAVSGAFSRGLNSLAGLNINDIKSIDILKDASATAIYGSKAANGVVIITTKSGSYNQKLQINLNHYTSISTPLTQEVMNAEQFREFYTVSTQNLRNLLNDEVDRPFLSPNETADLILDNPDEFFGEADTDWLELVTKPALTNNTNVSMSGGGENIRFYTSLNYMDQEGTIINTDFSRISSVSKLQNKFSDKFSISTKIGLAFTENHLSNGTYSQALLARPDYPVYNEDGEFTTVDTHYTGIQNPIAVSKITNEAKNFNLNGYLTAEYDISNSLKFNSRFSIYMIKYQQERYIPSFVDIGGFYGREGSGGGRGSKSHSESLRKVFENYFTYDSSFSSAHHLNLVAGTAWEDFQTEFFSASGQGYPDDFILNNLGSAASPTDVDGGKGGSSLFSVYLRANYNYKERYFLTFTGRGDASSKFSPENRWAIFPSAAIAWRISNENFLRENEWLDYLKFRASIGKVGTQNIGDYLYRTLYSPVSYAESSAIIPTRLGNIDLKWEETLQKDLGIDFSFFDNRISGTLGYYYKNTDGQLLNISVAPSSGFPNVVTNIATIKNRGYEVDLNVRIIDSKDFSWNASMNLSTNKSEVTHINGGPFSDPYNREALNLGTSIVKEGEPLGLLYGRVSDGIINNQAELVAYRNEIIETLGEGFTSQYFFLSTATVGSTKYVIDSETLWKYDIIGNSNPDFFGGFSNNFSFKNWSLYSFFNFSYGNELIWQRDVLNRQVPTGTVRNFDPIALNYYSAENTNTNRPIPVFGANNFLTNANVYDASFIKLKQLTLSYNFSRNFLDRIHLNNASIYASATNVFTITDYPGLDPEVSDDPKSIIGGGRDTDTYPLNKTYSLGIKLSL